MRCQTTKLKDINVLIPQKIIGFMKLAIMLSIFIQLFCTRISTLHHMLNFTTMLYFGEKDSVYDD